MRIVGIDPGYERCGVSIIEKGTRAGSETLLFSDCIQTPASDSFHNRLELLGTELDALLLKYTPDHLALETIFFNTNQKTAMDVAAVRGAVLYIARIHKLETFEYTPIQIKSAIAGSGRGNKKDVIAMLHHLVKINKDIKLDDEYDAIAVALTHSAIHR